MHGLISSSMESCSFNSFSNSLLELVSKMQFLPYGSHYLHNKVEIPQLNISLANSCLFFKLSSLSLSVPPSLPSLGHILSLRNQSSWIEGAFNIVFFIYLFINILYQDVNSQNRRIGSYLALYSQPSLGCLAPSKNSINSC